MFPFQVATGVTAICRVSTLLFPTPSLTTRLTVREALLAFGPVLRGRQFRRAACIRPGCRAGEGKIAYRVPVARDVSRVGQAERVLTVLVIAADPDRGPGERIAFRDRWP